MNKNRLMTVILAPKTTEKTIAATEANNVYTFKVAKNASKPEIKRAIEMMFEVKVDGVCVSNVKGKQKRQGAHIGHRASWKKAMVTLVQGEKIELMDAE